MVRLRSYSALIALTSVLAACEPQLDEAEPRLSRPASLPHIDDKPVAPSVATRAEVRAEFGAKALASGDLESARTALTEACTLDPSFTDARLDLARAYAAAGLGSVALDLLEAIAAEVGTCGTCAATLARLDASDARLAAPLSHSRGAALLELGAALKLPWQQWATETAEALKAFRPGVLESFVHADVPFVLARSCPECPNAERRAVEEHSLRGALLLVKVASRFDTRNPMLGGIPLGVAAQPACSDGCCRFEIPASLEPSTAQLEQLCFRPLTPKTAALTRLEIRYAPSRSRSAPPTAAGSAANPSAVAAPALAAPAVAAPAATAPAAP